MSRAESDADRVAAAVKERVWARCRKSCAERRAGERECLLHCVRAVEAGNRAAQSFKEKA